MEHYYTQPENISSSTLVIKGDEAKHLIKVLRKAKGNEIFVTDGMGYLHKCVIESVGKNDIKCDIIGSEIAVNEPSVKLTAFISILRNPDRFEFAVEKLTELGVHQIIPIITVRVISKGKDKAHRWQSIALSAMKQSQRCWLPKVNKPVNYAYAVEKCNDEIRFIAHEKQNEFGLRNSDFGFESKRSAALFIGPEGGFTDEEIDFATERGFKVISLGSRKFRSETAAIVASALLLLNKYPAK